MPQLVDYQSFDKIIIDIINILSYKFRYIECDRLNVATHRLKVLNIHHGRTRMTTEKEI